MVSEVPFKNFGNSWGEGGSSKTPLERKILGGGGGGVNQGVFRGGGGGVWIFSGTTHYEQDHFYPFFAV